MAPLSGAAASSEESDSSDSSGTEQAPCTRGRSIWRLAFTGFALSLSVCCVMFYTAYVRGTAVANAAVAQYVGFSAFDIEASLKAHNGDYAQALQDRAGRGQGNVEVVALAGSGGENELEIAVDEATVNANATIVGDQASDEAVEKVVNDLIQNKINEFLSEQQTNLNAAMPALIGPQVTPDKLPQTSQLKVDSFHNAESLYINTADCYKVESDLSTGTAVATLKLAAKTGTLEARGRVRPDDTGDYYHFKLLIYGFHVSANKIRGEIEFSTQSLTKIKVGWVGAYVRGLDGTCYSKHNPSQEDSLCTSVMNKKLKKQTGDMMWQLSAKLSHDAQQFVNKLVPFKLPEKSTTSTTPVQTTTNAPTTPASSNTTSEPAAPVV